MARRTSIMQKTGMTDLGDLVLPHFNEARGEAAAMQLQPPFTFNGVTMGLFPIPASMTRLQSFCDAQLNLAPDLVRFEPAMPFVFLMVLDYGQMAAQVANLGWVSQYEVAFGVPMRWSFIEKGQVRFHDWAVTCPFIFVDNELSMATGREVYGWPKVLAQLDPSIGAWINDPHGPREVLKVRSQVFSSAYKGEASESRPVLTVHHEPLPPFADFPTDLGNLLNPVRDAPRTVAGMARFGFDFTKTLSSIAFEGITNSANFPGLMDPNTYRAALNPKVLGKLVDPGAWRPGVEDLLWSMLPRMNGNTINLKQFRDSSSADKACYQAITNAALKTTGITKGGLLGQQNIMLGQLDGGYRIDLYDYGNQPVVEALGLEGTTRKNAEGINVVTLRPQFPIWCQMDMDYGIGEVVAWRSRSEPWQLGIEMQRRTGPDAKRSKKPSKKTKVETAPAPVAAEEKNDPPRYVTARGPALQALQGPFAMPDTTVRVLPLIADKAKLAEFLSGYLDTDQHMRFEPWGHHVYVVAFNYSRKSSKTDNIGLLSSREVAFVVPTICYEWYEDGDYKLSSEEGRKQRDKEKMLGVGLVRPFAYVDDAMVAISSTEVTGAPTLHAEVNSPPHTWMDSSGPDVARGESVLSVSALVLPAVHVGAGGGDETLLRVRTVPPIDEDDEREWRHVAHRWGPNVLDDLEAKYRERGQRFEQRAEHGSFRRARAMALELLAGEQPINMFSLKQFRDCFFTDRACYQGIVLGTIEVDELHEVHELDEEMHVSITRFPTQPIADTLGLIPKHESVGSEGIVETFEAIRPFWFRADLTEQRGRTLYERVGGKDWTPVEPPRPEMWVEDDAKDESAEADPGTPWRQRERKIMAGSRALNHLDRVHVPDVGAYLQAKRADLDRDLDATEDYEQPIQELTHAELFADLGCISPATVIDSILSRQWCKPQQDRDPWGKADFSISTETFGAALKEKLFPPHMVQRGSWPASSDYADVLEDQLCGISWQLWDDTRSLFKISDDTTQGFSDEAAGLMPDFFMESADVACPGKWSAAQWQQITEQLGRVIDAAYQRGVNWSSVIRPLNAWRHEAKRIAATRLEQEHGKLDPGQDPEGVVRWLRKRLASVAQE